MNSQKLHFFCALHRLVDAADRLSDEDFSKLGDESYSIEIRLTRKRNKDESILQNQETDLVHIIEKLTNFPGRENAQQFLVANFSSRKSVESIARKLDIPISKRDKIGDLREKITEATVGARLRSLAIQGSKV